LTGLFVHASEPLAETMPKPCHPGNVFQLGWILCHGCVKSPSNSMVWDSTPLNQPATNGQILPAVPDHFFRP
jgi:hypothetical protein